MLIWWAIVGNGQTWFGSAPYGLWRPPYGSFEAAGGFNSAALLENLSSDDQTRIYLWLSLSCETFAQQCWSRCIATPATVRRSGGDRGQELLGRAEEGIPPDSPGTQSRTARHSEASNHVDSNSSRRAPGEPDRWVETHCLRACLTWSVCGYLFIFVISNN